MCQCLALPRQIPHTLFHQEVVSPAALHHSNSTFARYSRFFLTVLPLMRSTVTNAHSLGSPRRYSDLKHECIFQHTFLLTIISNEGGTALKTKPLMFSTMDRVACYTYLATRCRYLSSKLPFKAWRLTLCWFGSGTLFLFDKGNEMIRSPFSPSLFLPAQQCGIETWYKSLRAQRNVHKC